MFSFPTISPVGRLTFEAQYQEQDKFFCLSTFALLDCFDFHLGAFLFWRELRGKQTWLGRREMGKENVYNICGEKNQ